MSRGDSGGVEVHQLSNTGLFKAGTLPSFLYSMQATSLLLGATHNWGGSSPLRLLTSPVTVNHPQTS